MRAAIYNQYLDTLGGGERYVVGFIKVLLELGYKVDLQWKDPSIVKKLKERFNSDIDVNVVPDIKRGDGYDLCFWVSDGSIPTLRARKNILHFQVPFHHVGGNSLLNKMKFFRIDHIVCNSEFTKKFIDQEYGVESVVVYPPVDTDLFKPKRKEKTILFVGRFSDLLQSKGQEILIGAFKQFFDDGHNDWKLILAGGVEVGAENKILALKTETTGYPIEIIQSPPLSQIKEFYGTSKFFWSASGFGVDQEKNPEKLEHFGITIVEAMSAGCIPLVFDGGGQKEIIENGKDGYLWTDVNTLVDTTKSLADNTTTSFAMSKQSRLTAQKFSYEKFKEKIVSIL